MHKVLVVENNPTIMKLISHHLEKEGCEVITASNGLEALMRLDSDTPDIIFTDIIMPKVGGDQLCAIIRRDTRLKDTFIAVHSSTSLEDNREILDLDADTYIAKGPETGLKAHVSHVLRQYRQGIRRSKETIGSDNLHPREITKELLLARKHHYAIFNNVAEAIVELDLSGKIVQANAATQKLLKRELREILSTPFTEFIDGREKENVTTWLDEINSSSPPFQNTYSSSYSEPLLCNSRRMLLNMVAISDTDDSFIIGILQDITRQKKTEEQLAQTLAELNAVIETIDYGIVLLDADFRPRVVNQAFCDLWHIPREFVDSRPTLREMMEHNRRSGLYDAEPDRIDEYFDKRVEDIEEGNVGPTEIRQGNGRVLRFQCTVLPEGGRLLSYYDITSLKNTEEKLEEALGKVSNLANHDPLTGLPNLRLARERLYSALSISKRKGWKAAIMFIDLDGFKEINDTHGHDVGDEVLKLVAQRLMESLREADTVARIGGDEFLVIQTEVPHRFAAANVAERIVKSVSVPLQVDGIEMTIGASVGIAIFPDNGEDSRVLMKKADDAMYYTKRIGKNSYTFTPD